MTPEFDAKPDRDLQRDAKRDPKQEGGRCHGSVMIVVVVVTFGTTPAGVVDWHRLIAVGCTIHLGGRETALWPSKLLQQLCIHLWRDAGLSFD